MSVPPSFIERRVNHRPGWVAPTPAEIEEARIRVVEAERRRIAQDVHDGVASQLVSLIATLDPKIPSEQRILNVLESSLLELKFIIDSMANNFCSIVEALATLRYRIQPALDRQGIQMQWNMEDAPEFASLTSERAMNVLRIAQEAVNNVLQHSDATEVEVSCTYREDCLELVVRDNGRGLDMRAIDGKKHGNGMMNMKNRAQILRGILKISGQAIGGTKIHLIVPIHEESV